MDFYKFPSTPYLFPPPKRIARSDRILTQEQAELFLTERIIVEEKIDGANLGISFDGEGILHLQNRGHYLDPPFYGQWKPLEKWLKLRCQSLFDVLVDDYILFGEWCYFSHSIYYNSLPDWFVAFDIYDKCRHLFLPVKDRNIILEKANISAVPIIDEGFFTKERLDMLLRKSAYGDEPCEGLYLRIDNDLQLIKRAKYVRNDFSQSIDIHWTKKTIQRNKIKNYY